MNKEPYDNFITSFKKKLWDTCSQEKVFENLENSGFEEVKSIFEVNVENYKSHILQTNGNNDIIKILVSNIKKEIENIKRKKGETREDILNFKREQFDSELEKKQSEFRSLINDKTPENMDFSDDTQDTPLEADNLEALIQEQLKDRELHLPDQSSETNKIVSDNEFTKKENSQTPTPATKLLEKSKQTTMITSDNNNIDKETIKIINSKIEILSNENKNLISEISKLRHQISSQNDAINKIMSSQILILKKIK